MSQIQLGVSWHVYSWRCNWWARDERRTKSYKLLKCVINVEVASTASDVNVGRAKQVLDFAANRLSGQVG